jgi:vancomycin resistance protein YoaR
VRRDVGIVLCGALLLASAAAAATWLQQQWLPAGRSLPGTSVGGEVQPDDESLGDWLERRRVQWLGREVVVELPEQYRLLTLVELGVELDVADTMRRTLAHAEQGWLGARLRRAFAARQGPVDIGLSFSFDARRAELALRRLAPDVSRPPVNARLDLEGHRKVKERPGREIDPAATLRQLVPTRLAAGAVLRVATREVPAEVSLSMLSSVDVSQVLASYETEFSDSSPARAENIRVGARLLSGTVILPGQTLSFNETVGPRRLDRGFRWAPVIIDDEMRPGVGGGTCQLASTLHAAAVYGGLQVVQRRSHSRPSGYIELGLDAMVIYGEVDLKLRNPYERPLIIHAFSPRQRLLRVELLGQRLHGRAEYSYAVVRTHEFYRRVTTKPWLAAGRHVRKQKGIRGYDVVSLVRLPGPDGTPELRRYVSKYRPTPEVFWVGPGYDLSRLPELPAGATHVEVDGEQLAGVDSAENPYAQDG